MATLTVAKSIAHASRATVVMNAGEIVGDVVFSDSGTIDLGDVGAPFIPSDTITLHVGLVHLPDLDRLHISDSPSPDLYLLPLPAR